MPNAIPHRFEMFHASLILLFAAVILFGSFAFARTPSMISLALLNTGFFTSAVLYVHGFVLLLHWTLVSVTGSLLGKSATALKVIASILFLLQPLTSLANGDSGLTWSNLVGIVLFHAGNMFSIIDMRKMFNIKHLKSEENLPFLGMCCNLAATSLLLIANVMSFGGEGSGLSELQLIGSGFLVFGGILFVVWSREPLSKPEDPRLHVLMQSMTDPFL